MGGWHSLLSIVYRGSRDGVGVAIEEGDAASASVKRARQELAAAVAGAGAGACSRVCSDALRSLEYQETLFEALAAWRQAFLSYYRWLDTGDRDDWTRWTSGRERFATAAARHEARFGEDLDFPAFDLRSAAQAVLVAERASWTRRAAAGLLIGVIALVGLGSPIGRRVGVSAGLHAFTRAGRAAWTMAVAPWRLAEEPIGLRSCVGLAMMGLVLVGFVAGALTGFTTVWVPAGTVVVISAAVLAFELMALRMESARGRLLLTAIGPLFPGCFSCSVSSPITARWDSGNPSGSCRSFA